MRIGIVTQISGVKFSDAWPRAAAMEWGGIPVRVLSVQDLLANKRASRRPKDLLTEKAGVSCGTHPRGHAPIDRMVCHRGQADGAGTDLYS